MRGVYFQVDRLSVDTLIAARYPCRLILDLSSDLTEVVEFAPLHVVEFCPLILVGDRGGRMRDMDLGAGGCVMFGRDVDQLKNEGSASDDAAAARQKVAADDVL